MPFDVQKMEPGIIYIDTSVGSREFEDLFRKRHGLKTALVKLDSADFAFTCQHTRANPFCNGDMGCRIGIERKTLGDMVGSLLKNRLGGRQIPLMLDQYNACCWVVIEGLWRPGARDEIEIPIGGQWRGSRYGLTYTQLESWMTRYDVLGKGRLLRWRTATNIETAAFVASKFGWWRKEWHKHSFNQIDKLPPPTKALLFKPNPKEKNFASLDKIGIKKMKKVAAHFPSMWQLYNASTEELMAAGLGKKDAKDVWRAIRTEYVRQ